MKEKIISWITNMIAKINEMAIMSMTGTVNKFLKFNPGDGEIITLIIDFLAPIAFAMIVVYFLIGIAEQYTHVGREITMDSIIKAFAGLLIADILINASYKIVELMMNMTNKIGPELMDEYTKYMEGKEDTSVLNNVASMEEFKINLIGACLIALMVLIGFGISLLCNLIIAFLCMSTKLEIMVRYAFAPLGLANFANSNDKSSGLKYLRKMLASSFYGGALCVVLIVAMSLGKDAAESATDYMLNSEKTIELTEEQLKQVSTDVDKKVDEYFQQISVDVDSTDQNALDALKKMAEDKRTEFEESIKSSYIAKAQMSDDSFSTAFNIVVACLFQCLSPVAAIGAVSAAKSAVNEAFGA